MTTVNPTTSEVAPRPSDAVWLADLTDEGPAGHEALTRLRDVLLRATRHQVWRLRDLLPGAGDGDLEDLAQQAANDAGGHHGMSLLSRRVGRSGRACVMPSSAPPALPATGLPLNSLVLSIHPLKLPLDRAGKPRMTRLMGSPLK